MYELGGNGLLLRGWNRGALIVNSSFDRLGDNAIVTCGNSGLADLSKLDVPAGTTIVGNIFSNLGVEVKQAGGVYSALSANHTLRSNIFYNLPRAGVVRNSLHRPRTFVQYVCSEAMSYRSAILIEYQRRSPRWPRACKQPVLWYREGDIRPCESTMLLPLLITPK